MRSTHPTVAIDAEIHTAFAVRNSMLKYVYVPITGALTA